MTTKPGSPLRQRMLEDMQLLGLQQEPEVPYSRAVSQLAQHYHRSPDQLGDEELRQGFPAIAPVSPPFYAGGLRLQEGTHLQDADVDSARLRLYIYGKRKQDRYVPLAAVNVVTTTRTLAIIQSSRDGVPARGYKP